MTPITTVPGMAALLPFLNTQGDGPLFCNHQRGFRRLSCAIVPQFVRKMKYLQLEKPEKEAFLSIYKAGLRDTDV
jgi:hypothetical protein